jgi:uncharacterized repeat protein (TIGR02543 family)
VKKFSSVAKAAAAVLVTFAFVIGSLTVMDIAVPAQSAQAVGPAFACTPDFYQVSAGYMYKYLVSGNTYVRMDPNATVLTGLNAIGFNGFPGGDDYIYGLIGSSLYQIGSDGDPSAAIPLTGVTPSTTGGDFIAANQLLTATNKGVFTLVNTSTKVVSAFTAAGSVSWAAADLGYNPTNTTIYGMTGTTLDIGVISGSTVTVTSKAVTGSLGAAGDAWGAAYVDSAGNAYFFDNTSQNLVEISAANLATTSPAATSVTSVTSFGTPNDGASCVTASSPLAPTVTTTPATTVTTTAAVLNGTIQTGSPASSGVASGQLQMCYSTSNVLVNGALSVSPVCAPTTPASLATASTANASLSVSGLAPGTTYYYQLEATNGYGIQGFSNVSTVTTVAATHTVTFVANPSTGASAGSMSPESTNAPTALTANAYTQTGFTFAGWNTAANGTGTSYANNAIDPFSADQTLYAQWTAIPASTVTFADNGGTGALASESANVPTTLTANNNTITRAGYTFAGWNTLAGGGAGGTAYADGGTFPFPTTNTTLYAQWTAIPQATVTFDSTSATGGSMPDELDNVPTALTTNTLTKTGYTFGGWTATDGSTYTDGQIYSFATSTTMTPIWTAISASTVEFDNNGGTGSMPSETANVPTALTANTLTKTGYTFGGWTATDGTTWADGQTYPFATSTILTAVWTAIPASTVIFDANGASVGSMTAEVNNVPTALTTNAFVYPGHTFSGWNTIRNGTGTQYADGATYPFPASNTLYAQWSMIPNKTVTFVGNGGTGTMSPEADNVPTALTTNAFTRPGFTFAGWTTAADGTGTAYADGASFPFTADTPLYATWTAIPNTTVTFDNNGGVGTMTAEVDNIPTALTANTFTRTGYTFLGWNTAANGTGTTYSDTASYPFTASNTLFAVWTQLPVLTFNVNGGTGAVAPIVAGAPTSLPMTQVARPGYVFTGWNTSADGTGTAYAPGALYPFSGNSVLFAQFTKVVLGETGVDPTPGITLAMLLLALGLLLAGFPLVVRRRRRDHGAHLQQS